MSVLQERVAAYCAQMMRGSGHIEVGQPVSLSAGWESDIFLIPLAVHAGDDIHHLEVVARVYFGAGALAKAEHEHGVMQRLWTAGYPCPQPLGVQGEDSDWGRPVLFMTRGPGNPMWTMMFRGDPEEVRWAHAAFVEHFVRLHHLDWRAGDGVANGPIPVPEKVIVEKVAFLAGFQQQWPVAGFGRAIEWLADRAARVEPGRIGQLHWDYHPANILVDAARTFTVIDWSGAEISDTRFDLAWTLVVVGSQEGWPAADRILSAYEAAAGGQADMDFFLGLAYTRRLFSVVLALAYGAEILGMRPGAETAMRDRLDSIRSVYDRWLALTGEPLPSVAECLAAPSV